MPYRFATQRADLSAFAAGRVLRSAPGRTAFPARLADEVFQRCAARLLAAGIGPPWTLYDPCCGVAHLLATLGFLHGDAIATLIGSDVDPDALGLAERNLALLAPGGTAARAAELRGAAAHFGKPGYADAANDAEVLGHMLAERAGPAGIVTRLFRADATDHAALTAHLGARTVDLVVTDVPHGRAATWQDADGLGAPIDPLPALLDALRPVLAEHALVAIGTDRTWRAAHPAFARVERIEIGKRRIDLFTPRRESTPEAP